MPQQQYHITDPQSGQSITLTGDSPPTEAELNEIFTHVRGQSSASAPQPSEQEEAGGVSGFTREFWERANPIELAKGLVALAQHPSALTNLVKADPAFLTQAKEAAENGEVLRPIRKVLAYLFMGFGHELDTEAELLAHGRYAEGAGAMAGNAAAFLAPEGAAKAVGATARATRLQPANRAISEAVDFGKARGVPVDAATATDNAAIRAAQHLSDKSLGGSQVAAKATQRQAEGLATVGEQLAAKTHPFPVSAEEAGHGLQRGVRQQIQHFDQVADDAYETLRQVASQKHGARSTRPGAPIESIEIPVDLRPARSALDPLYQQLKREAELVPLMGDKARALTALDRLVQAPQFAPLEVVDKALSDLKAMARGRSGTLPELRTEGQGTAARAVQIIDAQVRKAAANAGPRAMKALDDGRAATRAKYAVADVYQAIADEPVKAFARATAPKDSAIAQLRDVARFAPDELPAIGRAYLDRLLETATGEGGFAHAEKLFADWQKLGPDTKRILFTDPAYVRDLDRFFLLAKQIAKNANPSGTAHTVAMLAQGSQIFNPLHFAATVAGAAGLSTFLHSARGVRLLTEGFRLPKSVAAQNAWLARLNRFVKAAPGAIQASQAVPQGSTR